MPQEPKLLPDQFSTAGHTLVRLLKTYETHARQAQTPEEQVEVLAALQCDLEAARILAGEHIRYIKDRRRKRPDIELRYQNLREQIASKL